MYRLFIRPFLYLLQAEQAHRLAVFMLKFIQQLPFGLRLLRLFCPVPRSSPVKAMGLSFPSPIGLAAGFDKDAEVYPALGALGFGFVEVGTITAQGQPGNALPRLFRLVRDRALINRMGFNNHGADHAEELLKKRRGKSPQERSVHDPILGINIGKTKVVPTAEAVADYEVSTRKLAPYADYFVVNVSSPNTPGLRDLQAVSSLRPILQAVRRALDETTPTRRVPLLVKIAPDLADDDIKEVAHLASELSLDGIIATNTTISRENLSSSTHEVASCGAGGLSGAPLKKRALDVLKTLRAESPDSLTLISVGGIETAQEAQERLRAGANLVQIYSSLVYSGPGLPSRLARDLAKLSAS